MRKPICGMALEDEALGLVQGAGLAQDLLGDGELAEVVQAPGQAGELDLLGLEAHLLATRAASSPTM
jgi:hypothetical protein